MIKLASLLTESEFVYKVNDLVTYTNKKIDGNSPIGYTPYHTEIDYRDFIILDSTVSDFLNLSSKLESPNTDSISYIQNNLSYIAPPFVMAKAIDEKAGIFRSYGHEGRHRCSILKQKYGSGFIAPIFVFLRDLRANDIEDDDIPLNTLIGQDGYRYDLTKRKIRLLGKQYT